MASPNQLSFLPDDYLERKSQRRTNAICAVLFVIVLAGVGSAFTFSERATARLEEEDTDVEAKYVREAKRIEQAKEMHEKEKRMAHQAELSASLLERIPRSYVLAEITNSLPAGVSLLDLTMDSKPREEIKTTDAPKSAYEQKKAARQAGSDKNAPATVAPRVYDVTLKLTGICATDAQVGAFLTQLSRKILFRDVNLVVSEQFKHGEEANLRRFQIEMGLNNDVEVDSEAAPRLQTTAIEIKEQ